MRIVLLIVLALIVFAAAVIGPLAATGDLGKLIDIVTGKAAQELAETPDAEAAPDEVSELARALKAQQADLKTRAAALDERESRLTLRERELKRDLDSLLEMKTAIETSLEQLDSARNQGLKEVAESLAVMEPEEAALDLEKMEARVAARLLPLIDEDARGPMLDAMRDKEKRVQILDLMHASSK